MQKNTASYLSQAQQANRWLHIARRILLVLSAAVVFSVFWHLKLTGITMAGEAFCGIKEHIHTEECLRPLVCTEVECEPHMHTESCIYRKLLCETEEAPEHTHTSQCLAKELICTLPEQEGHTHTADCAAKTLTCGREETPGHIHDEACVQKELNCQTPEAQAHSHDSGCYSQTYGCGMEESEAHTHGDACLVSTLTCQLQETDGHSHGSDCYTETTVCTQEETRGHTHTEECYTLEEGIYICGKEESQPHAHSDDCYRTIEDTYLCELKETQGHIHTDACYEVGPGFGCGKTEAEGHIHSEECIAEDTRFGCELEITQGHTHTEECYETLEECPLEEHIHIASCYSNLEADLETSDDWEMTLAGLTRSHITAENVVAVAKSQLGYRESILNFQVDEQGIRRGITRYGQWYGNPYGDWSAMFVSFCLHYAGVEDIPANAGPEALRVEWEQAGYYRTADAYVPEPGNILFLHKTAPAPEENTEAVIQMAYEAETEVPQANAVAIITAFDGEKISVIEGDLEDQVAETTYEIQDEAILGYGLVPEDPTYAVLVEAPENARRIAQTIDFSTSVFTDNRVFVVYTEQNGVYYAFDGSGNAVQIYIDEAGNILSDHANPDMLLWTFTQSGTGYVIQNTGTKRHLHTFYNSSSDYGVTTAGAWSTQLNTRGDGFTFYSSAYAQLNAGSGQFVMTRSSNSASTFKLGVMEQNTVWLDGTNGGLRHLTGAPNESYTVGYGESITLPQQWQSPEKYAMRLKGWYDVESGKYYAPGAVVPIEKNTVFYADWVAQTYDIGRYNAQVADTVSTNGFITTHVFDYNYLFNVQSENPEVTVNASGHTEVWDHVENGTVTHNDAQSLDFIFVDYDPRGDLSLPNGQTDRNTYLGAGQISQGIYSAELGDVLFNPNREVVGKHYLGTGDYLFQFMADPSDEHYGYYYYNSAWNAASYNQSAQRFYVYEYLEATADSLNNSGKYSDFLPLNSPYANLNDRDIQTYTYAGENGEYPGVNHVRYDSAYSGGNNAAGNVMTNYAFGMSMVLDFYLPNAPGETDAEGNYGNKDLYGNQMHFKFSGDDDVWVLIDGMMVLDLGGVHGEESGDINFSTGIVTVNGTRDQALTDALAKVKAGEHKLTVMYLERGSSQSNAAFYFNLAPRFSLSIQKEDVLTQEYLNGAQFSVYKDAACTEPAELWASQASHDFGDPATNTFTVVNGVANMWGFASGNTYYIKETRAPDAEGYGLPNGIIRLTIDKDGIATYDVEVINASTGFTVHGVRIDEETQKAYIIATNVQESPYQDPVTVHVRKKWNDSQNHSGEYITVYLTITDSDGTVRRIREILLSDENDWQYSWTNLPKYDTQGNLNRFGVEEAYVPGYTGTVEKVEQYTSVKWTEAVSFQNGQFYYLRNGNNYLSTTSATAQTFQWVDEATAVSSPLAKWKATVSSGLVKLTNEAGQILSFNYSSSSSNRYFYVTTGSASYQTMTPVDTGSGFRLYATRSNRNYYISSLNSNGRLGATTSSGSGMVFSPMLRTETIVQVPENTEGYEVTNTPLTEETALKVTKQWDLTHADSSVEYLQSQVTVKLLANGVDTGRTVTLNLKNSWTASFQGLPYKDDNGNVISYTIEESWLNDQWLPSYGEIMIGSGDIPQYSTTLTNVYQPPGGPELPSTGSAARLLHILCGSAILLLSLVYSLLSRYRRERRMR